MPAFNLKKKKSKEKAKQLSPKHKLRELIKEDFKTSDLDGASDDEISRIVNKLSNPLTHKKFALHGTADQWTDPNPNPYKTSPLVNFQGGEFGGRWRDNFPGSGDQHINDDGDKSKNLRGNDLDLQTEKNEQMSDIVLPKDGYKLYVPIVDGVNPAEIKALLGQNSEYDGKNVYIILNSFEDASKLQGIVPGAIVQKHTG